MILCGYDWSELDLFAEKRQELIEEMLHRNKAVTTKELMETFSVSIETVRRDLLYMEQKKILKRVHGGAVIMGETKPFKDLNYRLNENDESKKNLCAIAAHVVKEGDIIGIDTGSTAVYFAQELKNRFENLTVVTYSLDVFNILCRHKDFKVFLCGGSFYPQENAFAGIFAADALKKLNMQKIFLFPYAVSWQHGICSYLEELYPLQKLLLEQGDKVYILADSSKFECKALFKIADMDFRYFYITDKYLPKKLKNMYSQNNIKIIIDKEDII